MSVWRYDGFISILEYTFTVLPYHYYYPERGIMFAYTINIFKRIKFKLNYFISQNFHNIRFYINYNGFSERT